VLNKTKSKYFYLPESKNFSEIENNEYERSGAETRFDVSDNGEKSEALFDELYAGDMFLFILGNLKSEQHIIIFLLQIIREEYKKFTYDELAAALKMHRVRYMQELRKTKDSIKLLLADYE